MTSLGALTELEPLVAPPDGTVASTTTSEQTSRRALLSVLVAVIAFGVALGLLWISGGFHGEYGKQADESAHLLSGLLLHDWLRSSVQNPFEFSLQFYERYPGFGIGVWPPAFYVLEAAWGSLFGFSKPSLLVLECAIAGAVCGMLSQFVSRLGPLPLRFLPPLLFLSLPTAGHLLSWVGVDLSVALLVTTSALLFARYLEQPGFLRALAFGVGCAMALLVKGSAGSLALMPLLTLGVSPRHLRVLRRPDFWLPPVVVLLVAAPWYLYTASIVSSTFKGVAGLAFTRDAAATYAGYIWANLGVPGTLLAILGVPALLGRARAGDPRSAVILAFPVAVILFHSIVPADIEPRYMAPAYAGLVLWMAMGAYAAAQWLGAAVRREQAVPLLAYVAASVFVMQSLPRVLQSARPFRNGSAAVASAITQLDPVTRRRVMVSRGGGTEGGLIAHLALLDPKRDRYSVLRGSKALARMDWHGREYQLLSRTPIEDQLDSLAVTAIAFDHTTFGQQTFAHHAQIAALLARGGWVNLMAADTDAGSYGLYVRRDTARTAALARRVDSVPILQNTRIAP